MPIEVVFPEQPPPWVDWDRDCIIFPALVNGKRVRCVVTYEFLMKTHGFQRRPDDEWLQFVKDHIAELRNLARAIIEAGKVNTGNEAVLSSELHRLREVRFSEAIERTPKLLAIAKSSTATLEEVAGRSAGLADAAWGCARNSHGQEVITLRLSDWSGSVTGTYLPKELESLWQRELHLRSLWGDLLQIRSHKQLDRMLELEAVAEA